MSSPLRLSRLHVWLVSALAAAAGVSIDAARLDGFSMGASFSGELTTHRAMASVVPEPANGSKAERDRELFLAAQFVDSINTKALMSLSNLRDVVYRLDAWRTRVLGMGHLRDTRSRQEVRGVLKKIREKSDVLNQFITQRVAEGEEDDGGNVYPSQRDNICSNIEKYGFERGFQESVQRLCTALDTVRLVVRAGEDEQVAVSSVSRVLQELRVQKEYSMPHISFGISAVLGEEWRWVSKQLEQQPAKKSAARKSASQGDEEKSEGLDTWLTDSVQVSHLEPMVQAKRVSDAMSIVDAIYPEEQNTLTGLQSSLQRLEFCRRMVVDCITSGDRVLRDRIRDVMRLIQEKSDAIVAQAERRVSLGEVEYSGELLPSQRENICKNLALYGLVPDLRNEVKGICDALDELRRTAWAQEDVDAAMTQVVTRMTVLKRRPGYADMRFAGELELIFTEEWRWLERLAYQEEQLEGLPTVEPPRE